MKYEVTVRVVGYASAVIDADTEKEAIDIAMESIDYNLYSERHEISGDETVADEVISVIECN